MHKIANNHNNFCLRSDPTRVPDKVFHRDTVRHNPCDLFEPIPLSRKVESEKWKIPVFKKVESEQFYIPVCRKVENGIFQFPEKRKVESEKFHVILFLK